MAREAAIRVICDRTGEESYVQAGVTLESMNMGGDNSYAALEITFRPVHGSETAEIIFNDLSPRAEVMVKELIDAISEKGFFVITPNDEKFAAEHAIPSGTTPPPTARQNPYEVSDEGPDAPEKKTSRRTFLEIEGDLLTSSVETAGSVLAKLLESPAADDLAVADAREALGAALSRSEYFKGLDEKAQKAHTKKARAARKVGSPTEFPAQLPIVDPVVLGNYGLIEAVEGHGDHPDSAAAVDDDDIFTPAGDDDGPDFL